MRIDILGAGAMGCLFGALLSRGNEVRLADPNRAKLAALKERGVTVVEGAPEQEEASHTPEEGLALVERLREEGLSTRDAVKQAAAELDLPKKALYDRALGKG